MSIEVYPVVHVNNPEQATEQSEVALENGADGVFLIDHNMRDQYGEQGIFAVFDQVQKNLPNAKIGINPLAQRSAFDAFSAIKFASDTKLISRFPDLLWFDDARRSHEDVAWYRDYHEKMRSITYLGGVAFKYTDDYTEDPDLAAAQAEELSSFVDVVTTSGPRTGSAPTPEKIIAMKEAIGSQPLAIASGVDIDNIANYAGSFDMLLVASSVETNRHSGIFDTFKLAELIQAAHEM